MKQVMQKIAERIRKYENVKQYLLTYGGYKDKEKTITYQTYDNAAGNHLFDEHADIFDITKQQGHCVRAMFQEAIGVEAKEKLRVQLVHWGVL